MYQRQTLPFWHSVLSAQPIIDSSMVSYVSPICTVPVHGWSLLLAWCTSWLFEETTASLPVSNKIHLFSILKMVFMILCGLRHRIIWYPHLLALAGDAFIAWNLTNEYFTIMSQKILMIKRYRILWIDEHMNTNLSSWAYNSKHKRFCTNHNTMLGTTPE